MSQRLHIGITNEKFYDCILITLDNARNKLLNEWLMYSHGNYLGPFKIRIGDIVLWKQVEPVIVEVLITTGNIYVGFIMAKILLHIQQ